MICKHSSVDSPSQEAYANSSFSGCPSAKGSGSWGWTDEVSGREFAAVGCFEGTSFLEITSAGKLVKLGFL